MSNEPASNDETIKRWTAKRRVVLVLGIRCDETTVVETVQMITHQRHSFVSSIWFRNDAPGPPILTTS
jgi:hypothetical protein